MEPGEAFSLIARAIDDGCGARGYLVVGDIKGNAMELTDRILAKLFPGEEYKLAMHAHPDVIFLEPEGKSRTIKVDAVRDILLAGMAKTSYSGGWKAGVIVGAERMQPAAANAFLKDLEEPRQDTIYLLLTDNPGALLPTVISRCQRIDLPMPDGTLQGDQARAIAKIFTAPGMDSVFARSQAALALAARLDALKNDAEDEDVLLVRKAFFATIMKHVRGWMVEGRVPRHLAFRNIEAVEEAYARVERFLGADMALSFMMDKLAFPKDEAGE